MLEFPKGKGVGGGLKEMPSKGGGIITTILEQILLSG